MWLQGPCSPQITGTSLYFLQTACPKLQWWCHPLNFHLVHFFLRSAITQNICLQSFSHSNYFPGRNSPKSTPHPPHPLHETALTHVNYLSCTRQSSRCACPCVNGWMCMWLGVQRGACVYYTTSPAANQLSSEPHHWALGRGPTTTEQDGTGRPSFSSKRGAQAPRQACDQTLS